MRCKSEKITYVKGANCKELKKTIKKYYRNRRYFEGITQSIHRLKDIYIFAAISFLVQTQDVYAIDSPIDFLISLHAQTALVHKFFQ